jgi:hypothetical protein
MQFKFRYRAIFTLLFGGCHFPLGFRVCCWVNPTDLFLLSLCVRFSLSSAAFCSGFRKHTCCASTKPWELGILLETSPGKTLFHLRARSILTLTKNGERDQTFCRQRAFIPHKHRRRSRKLPVFSTLAK